MRDRLPTSFLCCSECSCLSLLLIFEGLGILVILRLVFLRSLDNVEIAYRNPRVHERLTLRGFNFPPCLPDMVVVDADVQNQCDPKPCRNTRDRSHAWSTSLRFSNLISSPEDHREPDHYWSYLVQEDWSDIRNEKDGEMRPASRYLQTRTDRSSYHLNSLQECPGHSLHVVYVFKWTAENSCCVHRVWGLNGSDQSSSGTPRDDFVVLDNACPSVEMWGPLLDTTFRHALGAYPPATPTC